MNLEKIKENPGKMILQFSIPAIIAMILTSIITVTDGFFTGNYIGKEGIAAINLGLPIVYLYLGLGLMISVGGSVQAGILLGAKEGKKCNEVFRQTTVTTILVLAVTSVIIFLCFQPITQILHVHGKTARLFQEYYRILLLELPIMVLNNGFGMFIRGEGNPQFFMKISILNVVGNIVLDALFAGPLHWGIKGIAATSLISAVLCLAWILVYFLRSSKVYKFGTFSFDQKVFMSTILNGSSEFIGEMSMSITMFAYNLVILKRIGIDGVTAFTIVGYVAYVFSMILIGFGQGSSPLISFSYGAKDGELAKRIRQKTNQFVLGAGVFVILLMFFTAGWYSTIFVKTAQVREMVQSGIGIFVLSFLFGGINTISSFYFTSIGRAKESAIISSMRGLIVLLICIFTLPIWFGMTGVWMVAPVTEGITILVTVGFLFKHDKEMVNRRVDSLSKAVQ